MPLTIIRKSLLKFLAVTISLSILGLLLEGPVFAQEDEEKAPAEVLQEQHDTKDLEQLLRKYNTDSEKVIKDTSKIHTTDEDTTEVSDKEIEEIDPNETVTTTTTTTTKRATRHKKQEDYPYKNQSFSENIRIPLEKFQHLSEEELLHLLKENTKDSKWASYLDQFPRIRLLSVRLIKDKDAIPSAVKIIENKDKLVWFGGCLIATFILGFILERLMRKEGRGVLASIGLYMVRVLILTGVRLTIILYFYGEELKPASRVFKQTFLT
jgi:DNA-binding protein H-NS